MKDNKIKFKMLHHADQKTVDGMYNSYSPVFVFSTGRAGSKFLASLLDISPNITSYHEAEPRLQYFPNFIYHNQNKKEVLTKIIEAARMELILGVYIKNKIFVETNHCLTFFAPVIVELFNESKFVHLVRHPGDFVRSALRKGWHRNDSIWESGRVRMKCNEEWYELDQIEKLSWVWKITNGFIEEFKNEVEAGRIRTYKIEDISCSTDTVQSLFRFVGSSGIPLENIRKIQNTRVNEFRKGPDEPPNMKKLAVFPEYENWTPEMKRKLRKHTRSLAVKYGYDL